METGKRISQISPLNLAFVGDAVQEAYIKSVLVAEEDGSSFLLQKRSVAYLCCEAQAYAAQKLLEELTQEEADVFRRARNAKVNTVPKHASVADYHMATAIEAVIGFAYLKGDRERALQICARMREVCDQR